MKDDGNLDRTGEISPPSVSPPRPPSSEDDLLAGRAVDLNLLSREQLQEAVHEQNQSRSEGQSRSLCEILVLRGFLKTDDLSRLIKEQSRRDDGIPNLERYEIQERLGEGATAVVYRAWDRDLGRHVALKFMRGATVMSEVARQRFRREAQAAGSISHRNVIMIHDAGEAEGHPYLVMEIVEGSSLAEILQKKASPERGLLEILEKAARGMAAAHAKGVVHRDLKPANILVTAQGEPKVGDFGLAHLSDSAAHLTRTGTALGTPLYMAPEQAAGRAADISARTDV